MATAGPFIETLVSTVQCVYQPYKPVKACKECRDNWACLGIPKTYE